MTLTRRRVEFLSAALMILLCAGASFIFIDRHLERSFITYRIAQNIHAGSGFVYNPGEPILLPDASSPLYALLLSFLVPLVDLPMFSNIVGALSIALGGLAMLGLALNTDEWAALPAAVLYVTFPLLWITLGLDVTPWLAICLLGLWCYLKQWAIPAALILALALILRPVTAWLIVLIAADSIAMGRKLQPVPLGLFGLLTLVAVLWMSGTFGGIGPLPGARPEGALMGSTPSEIIGRNAISGLTAVATELFSLSPLWLALPFLAIFGLLRIPEQRWAILLCGWALLHLLMLGILGTPVYPWDLLPMLPALIGLAGLGVCWLLIHVRIPGAAWAAGAIAGVVVMLATMQSLLVLGLEKPNTTQVNALHPLRAEPDYAQAAEWLVAHTGTDARIATTRPGLLGYEAGVRPILDTRDYLTPSDATVLPPGDTFSWLAHHLPDVLVFYDSEVASLHGYDMRSDPWFASMYQEATRIEPSSGADALVVFTKAGDSHPITEPLVSMIEISAPLSLNRIGTDFALDPLEGGRLGIVTLQWLAEPELSGHYYVAIRIQNRDGGVAALDGRMVNFSGWPARTLITSYHTVELAPSPGPGVYDISVGLGRDAQTIDWHPVVQAKVPFEGSVFLGGISGVRQQFGDLDLIGYRLSRNPDGLEVLLLWEAAKKPVADYEIWIQVRDAAGGIAVQIETQPYGGSYPTSAWAVAEQVPDTYKVDISALPPGDYAVYAGLIAPDGTRLRTTDGPDAVFIGGITIQPE